VPIANRDGVAVRGIGNQRGGFGEETLDPDIEVNVAAGHRRLGVATVVVNHRCAGVQATPGVGQDLLRTVGHVGIGRAELSFVDADFDDDLIFDHCCLQMVCRRIRRAADILHSSYR
jgi:hypothetical protein